MHSCRLYVNKNSSRYGILSTPTTCSKCQGVTRWSASSWTSRSTQSSLMNLSGRHVGFIVLPYFEIKTEQRNEFKNSYVRIYKSSIIILLLIKPMPTFRYVTVLTFVGCFLLVNRKYNILGMSATTFAWTHALLYWLIIFQKRRTIIISY